MQLKKLFANLVSGWLCTVITGILSIILIPFLLREMGSDYALIVILLSVVGLIGLADLGIGGSLTRELAAVLDTAGEGRIPKILSSGLILYLCLACLATVIYFAVTPYFLEQFSGEKAVSYLFPCLLYGCSLILLTFISQCWITVIYAHQRYDIVNSVTILKQISLFTLQILIIPNAEDKVLSWVLIMVLVSVISSSFLLVAARLIESKFSLRPKFANWFEVKNILGLSSRVTFLQITRLISEKFDPFILAAFSTPLNVILYNSAGKLPAAGRPFITTIAQQLCPRATQLHVGGQSSQLKQLLAVGTRYSMLLGTGIFVAITSMCADFSWLWLGAELPDDWKYVADLMIGVALIDLITYAAGGTQWSILLGLRKLDFLIWTMVPTAIVNLLLSVYFVAVMDFGAKGVIIATLGIAILRRPVIIYHTSRLVDLPLGTYLRESYFRPCLILALTSLTSYFLTLLPWETTWASLVFRGILTFGIWFSFVWVFGVTRTEKQRLRKGIIGLTSPKVS